MLSTQEKERAVALLEAGWAVRGVARELGVSHTSIRRLWQKWQTEHSVARRPGTGRARITSPEEDNNLVRYIQQHPFHTCRRAIRETGFPGSERTARNRLYEVNIRSYVAAVKPTLNDAQRRQRLTFAETNLHRNMDFWNNVIFSDESNFQSYANMKPRVYREKKYSLSRKPYITAKT